MAIPTRVRDGSKALRWWINVARRPSSLRTAGFLNTAPFVWQSVKQSNNDS